MLDHIRIVLDKIILGIVLAAPIGPVNAEMIRRGLTAGFWGSFNVRLGGALANTILLLLAYFGLGNLTKHPKVIFTISILGVIALIYLGIKNILKAISKKQLNLRLNINSKHQNTHKKYSLKNGILVGFGLSFASPIGLMFWLSTFATSMQPDKINSFNLNDLFINLFIIAGVLIWGLFISIILHYCSKIIDEKKLRIVTALSGLILIYFGIKYGKTSFSKFHSH